MAATPAFLAIRQDLESLKGQTDSAVKYVSGSTMPTPYRTPITPDLVTFLRSHYVLDWHGLHGANHWARVKLNGLLLAAETEADAHVVELFAFLHDSCREDDGHDTTHGSRSAELVGRLRDEKLIRVSDTRHEWLVDACRRHSDGEFDPPLTVAGVLGRGPAGPPDARDDHAEPQGRRDSAKQPTRI